MENGIPPLCRTIGRVSSMASIMVAKSKSLRSCSIFISARRVDMAIPRLTASVWFNQPL